ncbi:hypothetical protein SAMN05660845_1904 [Flavobacterium swingsii]|uniref:Uncharacterized protein n=1 Tax=Flavobacterium swingsii TaxID=498292 RepID=A0A1I0YTW0_9FLAO|nr:hypothetical protein [Flavobacterium swingsii]SFB15738.1 hypothetical protein SAMN05660845_1904 [Flavobacterium swingsii]
MIIKITDKNQFNSESWQIKMSSLLHIFIHKTNNKSYLFEFKEWKFFSYKTHFSYTSNEVIEYAINGFFDKLNEFIKQKEKWEIDFLKFENLKFKTILYFNENYKDISANVFSPQEHEPFGKSEIKKVEMKPSDKALFDATEQINIGNLDEGYKILSFANLLYEKDINILFLLAKISMVLKKTEVIPSHVIALIAEKENKKFTLEQEEEFNNILMNYQKNFM